MKVDYFIVGLGLAGVAFCEQLRQANKTFLVFDDSSQQASVVAAGMYNPVILKRFTAVWMADEQLELAISQYQNIEKRLGVILDHKLKIYRRFNSIEEQNTWFEASDNPKLEHYLSTNIIPNTNTFIDAPHGLGEVQNAGRIDTHMLISMYKEELLATNQLVTNSFDYHALEITNDYLQYDSYQASQIVFCEGFGLHKNPYFNYLPLNGTKGEVLTIKAPDLKIDYAVKSGVFIMPESEDHYYVGATYNWKDKTNLPTVEAKEELLAKLKTFISCSFEVVRHDAGIRPTVNNRRPLVGTHFNYKNMHVLNGLGTRGVMIAPYAAKELFNFIETAQPMNPEISIDRFKV
ncbi:NAD(P)/FAD-dependent oxidoreductase [Bizionia sp. KMM 8389]